MKRASLAVTGVFFYFNEEHSEFFDSLGQPPESYHAYFRYYLIARGKPIVYNKQRIQSRDSSDCGQYCLYYCYFRARGLSMRDVLTNFDPDSLLQNDKFVHDFTERIFQL